MNQNNKSREFFLQSISYTKKNKAKSLETFALEIWHNFISRSRKLRKMSSIPSTRYNKGNLDEK
ncbi:hypothetical protein [Chryseobacterium sp. RU37D]|uniref:hypothetical protein n=1 Tax=Chryseobacterium sp. RU37D TaxID=1907397 RepID=UPI0009712627|nr:hypothetical protein [Chryseobacterium sp. RU37D]